jgi:hypothetical protein
MLPFSFGESPAVQLYASRNHTLHLVFFDRRISPENQGEQTTMLPWLPALVALHLGLVCTAR